MQKWAFAGLFIILILLIGVIIFYPGGEPEQTNTVVQYQQEPAINTPASAEFTQQNISDTPTPTTATLENSNTSDDAAIIVDDSESSSNLLTVQPGQSLLPTPLPLTPEAGKITGKVIDQNGNPIPSASLYMQAEEGIWIRRLKSNYSGQFVVSDPPESSVNISASMNGYFDAGEGSAVVDPSQAEETVLTLQQQALSVSGQVTYRDDNSPVANFSLVLSNEEDAIVNRVQTDAFGMYAFQNVTKGQYTVSSNQERNESIAVDIPAELNGRKIVLAYQDLTNVNFEVITTSILSGIVQTMEKRPVSGAEVKGSASGSKVVETNPQGGFEYPVPVGATLLASHEQYGMGISGPVTEEQLHSDEPLVITLQSPGSIFGKVFDQNDQPIQQADVRLVERWRGISYQAQSNIEGIYSFDDVPLLTKGEQEEQHTHTIQFSKYGYESKSMDVILYPGEVNTRDVVLQSAASISGQVFDAANSPLPGVEIQAFGKEGTHANAVSDAQGVFVIQAKMNETFDLQFQYLSSPILSDMKLNVPAGTTGLQITLDHNEWVVSGRVSSDAGELVSQFSIVASSSIEGSPFQRQQQFVAQDGQFQFVLNQPGEYQILCIAEGHAPVSDNVSIDENSNSTVQKDFVLQQNQSNGSIVGEFVPPAGTELVQVDVVGLKSVPTHGNQFFLHKLPEGKYSVLFYVRNNQTLFPIPLGALPSVEVQRNQETDVGKVSPSDLAISF